MSTINPTVSVILPVYNREILVRKALESVLKQTFSDLELILVDDASTDGTPRVLSEYAHQDNRVRIVTNAENSRLAEPEWEPRNDGLKVARGEFVAYLDSDNCWHRSFLQTMIEAIRANPGTALAHCDSLNFYRPEQLPNILRTDMRFLVFSGRDCAVFSHNNLEPASFGSRIYVDTNEMMHRRSIFPEIGGYWATAHPEVSRIQMYQGNKFPYRRHNDLELFERIYRRYGPDAILHVRRTLVKFIYPGATSMELYSDEAIDSINESAYSFLNNGFQNA